MATDGSATNMCSLCLKMCENLQLLPCKHVLCDHCIDANKIDDETLTCYVCRKPNPIHISTAENVYLKCQIHHNAQTLDETTLAARKQDMCDTHPTKLLEFYCCECYEAVCFNCKLTRHDTHKLEDLSSAVETQKQKLLLDQQRLQKAVSAIKADVGCLERERTSLSKQTAHVEKGVRDRHAAIVKAAEKHMEETLTSLRMKHTDQNKEIREIIKHHEVNTEKLSTLLHDVDSVINSGTAKYVLSVAQEMISGRGSQTAVKSMTSRERRPTLRPDLHSSVSDDDMTQTTRDYLGTVRLMEMKVTERFRCSEDPDTEVFSLCHEDSDPPCVVVSYDRLGRNENAPVQKFTESGRCVGTSDGDEVGRISHKRYSKGWCIYVTPEPGEFVTYCKNPASSHLQLINNLNGDGDIYRTTDISTDPITIEHKTEFTININRHRAFDVDTSENYFAVVEEAGTGSSSNQVHLYDRSQKFPVSTYHPPVKDSQPTDVLFHHIGGQPVLLVADGLNSALHVLSFQGGQLEFDRYLCEGCPLLQKPSALTVDIRGRVWLGCKGGAILTMEKFQ